MWLLDRMSSTHNESRFGGLPDVLVFRARSRSCQLILRGVGSFETLLAELDRAVNVRAARHSKIHPYAAVKRLLTCRPVRFNPSDQFRGKSHSLGGNTSMLEVPVKHRLQILLQNCKPLIQ